MSPVHRLPARYLQAPLSVHLAGCGGTGTAMLTGLARLDRAMRALGHPGGLQVTVFDPDEVTLPNTVRQGYTEHDIGVPKSVVAVTRINHAFGLGWHAVHGPYETTPHTSGIDLLVECVDSRRARRDIARATAKTRVGYFLSTGNEADFGQAILGQPAYGYGRHEPPRLPDARDLHPELFDADLDDDHAPSCSAAEALTRQELFINDMVATPALALLARLFKHGSIDWHAAYINLRTGTMRTRPVPGPVTASCAAA